MTIFNVSNASQLKGALAAARGGDTISLSGGNYGDISIAGLNFASAVTVTSAVGATAHFDTLRVQNSSLLTFRGIDMGRGLAGSEPEYTKLVSVIDSSGIKMDRVSIHGSLDNNPANDGVALALSGARGFEITNSRIEQAFRGLVMQQSSDVKVAGMTFTDMRSDAINVAAVIGISIDNNYFTNFRPISGDHADAIQFWNVGQPYGSSNINITNNVVMNGTGIGPQGIFMSDNNGWAYTNVVIRNNLIYGNDSYHGIAIFGGRNVEIEGNSTLSRQGDNALMWVYVANSTTVDLRDNLAERIIIGSNVSGLTQFNNKAIETDAALKAAIPNLNNPANAHDLVVAGIGYQDGKVPVASPPVQKPALPAIFGTAAAWETVRGTAADEMIYGIARTGDRGTATRDWLYGGGGNDIFVLGDGQGIFYDDGSATSAGRADLAAIMDFDRGDKIMLAGTMADYVMKYEVINGKAGTSIFRDDNHNGKFDGFDEYIAHVTGSQAALNLTASDFMFAPRSATDTAVTTVPGATMKPAVESISVAMPAAPSHAVESAFPDIVRPAPHYDHFTALP